MVPDPAGTSARQHRIVHADPWKRQLLWLLAAALAAGGLTIWFGLGTALPIWLGAILIALAVVLAGMAIFLRTRARRAMGASATGSGDRPG